MVVAWAHLYRIWSAWTDAPSKQVKLARAAAEKAVAADHNDFWGHAALGFAELFDHRHERALAALARATELNPNSADVHMMRGQVLNLAGHPEEGLAEVLLAVRHNPHYPGWYLQGICRSYFMLGRYEEAIPFAERLVAVAPDMALGRLLLVACYAARGDLVEARVEMTACLAHHPDLSAGKVAEIVPLKREADLTRYLALLRSAGLPDE